MIPALNSYQALGDPWGDSTQRQQTAGARDFLVSVELWTPLKASGVRKPPLPRRISDRRDSLGNLSSPADEKRIKEKSSWFRGYGNVSSATGSWRPATCKLSEDGDRCVLNVYVDETILQQSIYVHLLRCTDIRPADRSLFFRMDCLGIHTNPGQRWLDGNTDEAIYIQFTSSDALNTWLALLRSYAIPETYGRRLAPANGGLYRMWRQVDLHVVQGRSLGVTKVVNETSPSTQARSDSENPEAVDMDVFCEIYINGTLCGRTTVKNGAGTPVWHEQFTFGDLPPFGDLLINVYREKKVLKPQLLGTIHITLGTFRRGEFVDGWFPVVCGGPSSRGLQVGEVKLKIKMDEEIILPGSAYASLMQSLAARNTLDLLNDLEQELKLEHLSNHIIAIAVARNILIRDIFELADREVGGSTRNTQNTLFRGNSVLTKTVELAMSWYGKAFLEASVGRVIRRLCAEKIAIEVDPVRSGKGLKDLEKNVEQLVYWCGEFWKQIYAVRGECPNELRRLFQHVRELVERRYERTDSQDLRWQSVSAFCFLRFIVPAILHPHLFGLCPGLPPAQVQRSLILIAKVMQSLANLNITVQKEEFMRGLKVFMQQSLPAMIDYIVIVSTPVPEPHGLHSPLAADKHDRLHIMNALRERGPCMPTLHRDTISLLPHLLDVPQHLAIISSAVVRNSRRLPVKGHATEDSALEEFSDKCLDVEREALNCVTQLAPRPPHLHGIRTQSKSSTVPLDGVLHSPSQSTRSPTSPASTSNRDQSPKKRRSGKSGRPSTAPSSSDSSERPIPSDTSVNISDLQSSVPADSVEEYLIKPSAATRNVPLTQRPSTVYAGVQEPSSPGQGLPSESQPFVSASLHLHRTQSHHVTTAAISPLDTAEDASDDTRRRKGFLRGILARR